MYSKEPNLKGASLGKAPALLTNIRLGYISLKVTNNALLGLSKIWEKIKSCE
jgi:hypothetical protein